MGVKTVAGGWVGRLQRATGWSAVISGFVFLFFWQMTSVVMPGPRGHAAIPGPFADSPAAQLLTIASLILALTAAALFIVASGIRVWVVLIRRNEPETAAPATPP